MVRMLIVDPNYRSFRFQMFLQNGFKSIKISFKRFPDGEIYVRFLNPIKRDGEYYIVLRGFPDQNEALTLGQLIASGLVDRGVEDITLIMPYFPYARQDKEFIEGEVVSARAVEKIFYSIGVKRILTLDVHNPEVFDKKRFINLSSRPLWEKFIFALCSASHTQIALIAPDMGRKRFVESLATRVGARFTYFLKRRDLDKGEIVTHVPAEEDILLEIIRESRCIMVIDDIIATGGTLANVVRTIRLRGYKGTIIVGGTHGLFLGTAVEKLFSAGTDYLVATDTVDNPYISELLLTAPIFLSYIL